MHSGDVWGLVPNEASMVWSKTVGNFNPSDGREKQRAKVSIMGTLKSCGYSAAPNPKSLVDRVYGHGKIFGGTVGGRGAAFYLSGYG